jgi:hypothetical protein
MDFLTFIGLVAATLLIVAPNWLVQREKNRRDTRVSELQQGGKEEYFEEKRDLQTYPFTLTAVRVRLFGLALVGVIAFRIWAG